MAVALVFHPARSRQDLLAAPVAAALHGWPGADEVYTPLDVMHDVIAKTIVTTNVTNAGEANEPVPSMVAQIAAAIHA